VRRIELDALLASPMELDSLARLLRGGGVAAVPTETFYGLAADPESEAGVGRVLAWKGREDGKPLLVLVGGRAQIETLGVVAPDGLLDRLFGLWPAPLTVVLPVARALPASRGAGTLAVRVPAHARLRALLSRVGPVTGTSLNRAGQPPCSDPGAAAQLAATGLDVFVDGGRTPGGPASTLLDATVDPPRVLRPGAFAWPPA
jgi:L-threonylcarbamoyladenylate synthase